MHSNYFLKYYKPLIQDIIILINHYKNAIIKYKNKLYNVHFLQFLYDPQILEGNILLFAPYIKLLDGCW